MLIRGILSGRAKGLYVFRILPYRQTATNKICA